MCERDIGVLSDVVDAHVPSSGELLGGEVMMMMEKPGRGREGGACQAHRDITIRVIYEMIRDLEGVVYSEKTRVLIPLHTAPDGQALTGIAGGKTA